MKEITHEEVRTVKVTDGYMSVDGVMFASADKCLYHERMNIIKKAREECTALREHYIASFGYEIAESLYCSENDTFYTFRPKSQEDIDRFKKYVDAVGCDLTVNDKAELEIKDYFVFESDCNCCIAVFSREYVKARYEKYIELMFGEARK